MITKVPPSRLSLSSIAFIPEEPYTQPSKAVIYTGAILLKEEINAYLVDPRSGPIACKATAEKAADAHPKAKA
jgi:hypothetical protein